MNRNTFNYKDILEHTGTASLIINNEGYVVETNNSFLQLSGYSRDEVEGKMHIEKFIHEEDLEEVLLMHRLRREDPQKARGEYEFKFVTREGEVREVMAVVSLIGQTKFSIASLRDMTPKREIKKDLKKSKKIFRNKLIESYRQLERNYEEIVKALGSVVEMKDPYTANHQQEVARIAETIGKKMNLSSNKLKAIYRAGILHDIGKIKIPAEILNKPGKLSEEEFTLIKRHPRIGYEILQDIEFSEPIDEIILQHHEKLDGSGYPRGLKERDILPEAQILAVADVVEAMSSHRPYRPALGVDKALAELKRFGGQKYNEQVVDVCTQIFEEEEMEIKKIKA